MATSEYYYNIGDVIQDKLILEQIRVKKGSQSKEKGYIYKCLKDGYIGEKSECQLRRGGGCPICYGRKAKRGVNDFATVLPHLVDYFVNKEEAYLYTRGSGVKVLLKCPNCGTEKKMAIDTFVAFGLGCNICSDGLSYPEKFVASFLGQLNVEFITQYSPSWAEGKRYDFYLPKQNIIIETHGEQHYLKKNGYSRKRPFEQEKINDLLKETLAKGNLNCKYVQLDCRESSLEWIKENIKKEGILESLKVNEEQIDWEKCNTDGVSSKVKQACDLWNSGVKNSVEIAKILNINYNTVSRYLKKGKDSNLCDYSPSFGEKRVKVLETNREYASAHELERCSEKDLSVRMTFSSICRVCRGERGSYKGYHLVYV